MPFTSQSRQCLLKVPFFSLLQAQHSSLPQVGCFHGFHGLGIISGSLLLSNTKLTDYCIHFQPCSLFVRTPDSTISMLKFLYLVYSLTRRTWCWTCFLLFWLPSFSLLEVKLIVAVFTFWLRFVLFVCRISFVRRSWSLRFFWRWFEVWLFSLRVFFFFWLL